METGGSRRGRTLSDENPDSPNLRDFLRVKEDDSNNNLSGLTLRAVLSGGKRPPPQPVHVNRTLLDVIKDDPNYGKESKKSWKALKSKLRLRRAGAAWTSSVTTPTSDVPIVQNPNRMISRRLSTRFNSDGPSSESTQSVPESNNLNSMPSDRAMMLRRNSSRVPSMAISGYGRGFEGSASVNNSTRQGIWDGGSNGHENSGVVDRERAEDEEEEAEEEGVGETAEEEGGEPAERMSLMALLAETDRQMGLDGSTYITGDDEDEDEEEVESRGVEYNSCCVCMVRHKGAAFIPCGHTFCRLCSRELWVQRGNCPLCNGFILEVLDIF